MTPDKSNIVLYIVGFPRSGSTLLGNLLGEVPSIFHAGELYHVWARLVSDRTWSGHKPRCGCGEPLKACPLWRRITELGLAGGHEAIGLADVQALQRRAMSPRVRPEIRDRFSRLRSDVYRAIHEVTGSSLIVDSSKLPAYGRLLAQTPDLTTYFIHLVRDPRGVLFSRQRRLLRGRDGRKHLRLRYTILDAYRWMRDNRRATALRSIVRVDRQALIRYEDFARDPRGTVAAILKMVGAVPGDVDFISEGRARLGSNHTVRGNRNRFLSGEVEIREDLAWRRAMGRWDQRTVALLTSPVFFRYGYSV